MAIPVRVSLDAESATLLKAHTDALTRLTDELTALRKGLADEGGMTAEETQAMTEKFVRAADREESVLKP